MGRPILRLATRIDRRTRWTAWAIAFACMVFVGSLNLVDGLSAGVDSVTARFSSGPAVYLSGNDLLASSIDPSGLAAIPTDYATLRVHMGTIAVNGQSLDSPVASLTEFHGGNASVLFPATSQEVALDSGLREQIESASGQPVAATANVSLFGLPPRTLAVAAPPTSRPEFLPDTWAWVRPELLVALSPSEGILVQAVLTSVPLDPSLASSLGLRPLQTVGAVGFTQASVRDARTVLALVGGVLAVVIGLLAHGAMGLEVHLRQEEIRTLRRLGASARTVGTVYQGQALVLGLVGATLGSALGIVLARGIVSFAPLLGFPNLILLPIPMAPVAIAYLLAAAAASIGGLVPVRRAARLASTREAIPS